MGAGLLGASTGLSAAASAQAAASQNVANEYNARIQERNAQIDEIKADESIRLGKVSGQKTELAGKGFAGSQKAKFAASGVVVDDGSAMDVINETMDISRADSLMVRHNAAKEAWSYREQAKGRRAQASLSRSQYVDPRAAFASTLLTSGASAGAQYSMAKGV